MFGFSKKAKQAKIKKEDLYKKVEAYYEGSVDTADYWDPENLDETSCIPLLPNGIGKITFKLEGRLIESYEGDFVLGSYQGKGKLYRKGKVFEGSFHDGKYTGE